MFILVLLMDLTAQSANFGLAYMTVIYMRWDCFLKQYQGYAIGSWGAFGAAAKLRTGVYLMNTTCVALNILNTLFPNLLVDWRGKGVLLRDVEYNKRKK